MLTGYARQECSSWQLTWYKLGDIERGNKALTYAAKLQNETGGWFGSYAVIDNPKPTDKKEYT